MAEQGTGASAPAGSTSTGSSTPEPQVAKWLFVYTFGRLAIAAALIALLWVLGLPGTPGFLFGVLLAMPVSYLALKGVRERLTSALVLRAERKEQLRAELRGTDADNGV